jgi:NAD(P)-dependent dehydrogenase (short-subunit alcohol dehydrogenase family)
VREWGGAAVPWRMPSVLITGASRGIGKAAAQRLAAAGWDVYAGVRRAADGEALATGSGGRIHPVILDITDAVQVAALDAVLPARLDAVVNNAGVVVAAPVEAVTLDAVRGQFEINVLGQLAVTQAVLPRLRATGGRIVFVSSLSGRISTPLTWPYTGSKFALEAMADALRLELRPWRIPVVLIEPAQTATDMWSTADQLLESTVASMAVEHVTLYQKHIEGQRKMIPKSQKVAAPVDGVADAITKALTARRPRARYVVGAGPKMAAVLLPLLPARLRDAALAASGGVPRRP